MAKNILAIDLSTSGVRLSVSKGGIITQDVQHHFSSAQDYKVKEQLKDFVHDNGFKQMDLDDVALSWSHIQSTLVPMNVFNDSSKEAIHQLCYGYLPTGIDLDFNRLPQHSMVNVYGISDWVKMFFVMNFPRVVMQHEGTLILRQLFTQSSLKPKAVVSIHKQHFLFALVQNNDLKYYNYFEFTNAEDLLYYIGFALQQMHIQPTDVELLLNEGQGCELDLNQVKTYYTKLYQPKTDVQSVQHYLTKALELCV